MIRILTNDGIDETGKKMLLDAGFEVITNKVEQGSLGEFLDQNQVQVLTVRSATKVDSAVLHSGKHLKLVARGGVGIDNIDSETASKLGIPVINTPASSSDSVAELVIAGMFSMCRFLYDSNRQMPAKGDTDFNDLKKKYAGGTELKNKTLGIVGLGRIGKAVASRALGLGMKVLAYDPSVSNANITIDIHGAGKLQVPIQTSALEEVISNCDYLTLHVPGGQIIGENEINKMKKGVCIINTSRGGVVDEKALIEGLNTGKIAHAFLDVFTNEPKPDKVLLQHTKISLTPHIGAATKEAQERIGIELAEKIIANFKN
ncbi:MAG: NAD(P)-dependent oxidoreductase [Bacteroidota bacterium]